MRSDIKDNCNGRSFDFIGFVFIIIFCISAIIISNYLVVEKTKENILKECKNN